MVVNGIAKFQPLKLTFQGLKSPVKSLFLLVRRRIPQKLQALKFQNSGPEIWRIHQPPFRTPPFACLFIFRRMWCFGGHISSFSNFLEENRINVELTPEEGRERRIRGWGPGSLCLINPSQVWWETIFAIGRLLFCCRQVSWSCWKFLHLAEVAVLNALRNSRTWAEYDFGEHGLKHRAQ